MQTPFVILISALASATVLDKYISQYSLHQKADTALDRYLCVRRRSLQKHQHQLFPCQNTRGTRLDIAPTFSAEQTPPRLPSVLLTHYTDNLNIQVYDTHVIILTNNMYNKLSISSETYYLTLFWEWLDELLVVTYWTWIEVPCTIINHLIIGPQGSTALYKIT